MDKSKCSSLRIQEVKPALITCITIFDDSASTSTVKQLGLPERPVCIERDNLDILWSGPRQWTLIQWQLGDTTADFLIQLNEDQAQTTPLDSGRIVFSIQGESVSERLSNLVAVDLHPNEFKPGALATTVAAHMPVTTWRQQSGAWYLMGMRSYAESLREVLSY